MKELFTAYSRYNRKTNDIVFSYVDKLSAEQLGNSINAYYKNIAENVIHVMGSDIKWLTRLSRYRECNITRDILNQFKNDDKINITLAAQKKEVLRKVRSELDEAIMKLVKSMPEDEFVKSIDMQFGSKIIEKKLWKLLLQWFNHHTHHRGQVSIQLDLLGIEHDFSMVLDKID